MADADRLMTELRESAAELQREIRAVATAAEQLMPVTVEDDEKAVKLTLAKNGAVEALVLDEDWRDKIGEESLGAAVSLCYQTALGKRLDQMMTAVDEQPEDDTRIATPAPAFTLGDPTTASAEEGRSSILDAIHQARDQREAYLDKVNQRGIQPRDAVNSAKTVVVSRRGATITGVALDERWVRNANDGVIEREIVRAMNNVMAMSNRDRQNTYEGFPAVQRLMEMTKDPREMLRRMGCVR
jgi:DNA-binding protein YbaB